MVEERPEVSVIVVNWNSGEALDGCLDSVGEAAEGRRAEVLVVDNASTDGSAEGAGVRRGVRLIRNPENVGFAGAANRGLSEASGEALLLLNPDARIDGEALGRLLGLMKEDGRLGMVGCESVDAEGRRAPGYEMSFPGQRGVTVAQREGEGRDVAWVSGACVVVRREMVEDIGRLDDGFFMYCEDVDWCYRARKAGWRVVTLPGVTVKHELGGSSTRVSAVERARWAAESRARFYRKHYSWGRAGWLRMRMAASGAAGMLWRALPGVFSRAVRERMGVSWAVLRAAVGSGRAAGGEERE
ncbi:MAG: glycosyltransferase family 2 protein [Armatimonadota bacterium]|nr:MAG: glycosyltransferase family 2 protein [Armatimonadota bacterium]